MNSHSTATPYLSIVATSRNDNHGGDLTKRMQTFVNALLAQCERHRLPAELILVEWNPPADRGPLVEALQWPKSHPHCPVRVVTVPADMHHRYKYSNSLPLFQMIAKNVGIRRARAPFVLCTNIDIVFNDAIMKWLASRPLQTGKMYRIDRHDVMTDVPVDASIDEQLNYCESHYLRVNRREGTFRLTPEGKPALEVVDVVNEESGVTFGEGWYAPILWEGAMLRAARSEAEIWVTRQRGQSWLHLCVSPAWTTADGSLWLEVEDASGRVVAEARSWGRMDLYVQLATPTNEPTLLRLRSKQPFRRTPGDARPATLMIHGGGWVAEPPADGESLAKSCRACRVARPQSFEAGVEFVEGWQFPEWREQSPIFWAGNEAVLDVTAPPDRPVLCLTVDAGPSQNYGPFEWRVHDVHGEILAQGTIQRKHLIDLDLQLQPGKTQRIVLRPVRAGLPYDDEGRVLNVQVLAATWMPIAKPRRPFTARHSWGQAVKRLLGVGHVKAVLHRVLAPVGVALKAHPAPIRSTVPIPQSDKPKLSMHMPVPDELHLNACGDFTMMARENWMAFDGNPELEMYSLNLDSLACYQAHHGGAPEEIIPDPCRIYHIEHDKGSGWTPEGAQTLMDRLAARGIEVLPWEQVLVWAQQMKHLGKPLEFHSPNWGLGHEDLPETRVG